MSSGRLFLAGLLCLSLAACAGLPARQRAQAVDLAEHARSDQVVCAPGCEIASPLLDLGDAAYAASTPEQPHHSVILLDQGQDSLLARVHLIRSARHSIELQTFIFDRDDTGSLVLDELMAAARRGVKVRVLLDQLYGLGDPGLEAALAGFHRNFELRLYNPTWGKARTQELEFAAGVLFEFRRLNQRMHSKLLLVDDRVAVIGGRNYQDRYFDWNPSYDYRDRDLLVAGPVTARMAENFEAFWQNPRAVPAERLKDVAEELLAHDGPPPGALPEPSRSRSPRVQAMAAAAEDGALVFERLRPLRFEVGAVEFYADLPKKHEDAARARGGASAAMRRLVTATERELLLQTPYLVLSRQARRLFREMHQRRPAPRIRVSTNSLAATDAFPVYAMSHKYKRLYLRELGFQIHEFKVFPGDAPIDLTATGVLPVGSPPGLPMFGSGSAGSASGPVPLKRAGLRAGLHAKSMVIDERIGVVGSHNFDPRSDRYNTESLVVVPDPAFARALAASIRRDMAPENAWLIAAREKPPIFSGLNYNLGKLSEKLPIFDLWPFPYASSYELRPGCPPLPPSDSRFRACYQDVGDFPDVDLPLKAIYTRILTAFGAGLVPIL